MGHRPIVRRWGGGWSPFIPLGVGAVAVAYIATAKAGLAMDAVAGFATVVWPPTGIALAALLIFGRGLWPGVFIGAFTVNAWTGAPVPVALGIAAGNTLEAVLGAAALRRVPGFRYSLERLTDVGAFILLASVLASSVSASIGTLSLALGGVISFHRLLETWRAWYVGDAVGALVVAPLLLTWATRGRPSWSIQRFIEAAALGASFAGLSLLVFNVYAGGRPFERAYLLVPCLVWAALRFGPRGAATMTFATAGIAILGTATGRGPFAQSSLFQGLFSLQVFIAMTAITFLLMAAAIAERLKALNELEMANVELESRVSARDEFITTASHELRTPLSALMLQASLAMKGHPIRTEVLTRQVRRLSRLVDNLLDVSRVASGPLELDLEEVDLAAVARETVARLQAEAAKEGSAIALRAERSVNGRWDSLRVDQILTNLLTNALKYGANKPIEVVVDRVGNKARLVVQDHGIGIAAADLARIFERYERGVSSRHFAGLGLGLWIVRQLVEAHGGNIRLDSQLGVGSTFTVELPAGPPEAVPDFQGGERRSATPSTTILVVEDDPDAREGVSLVLESAGYVVTSVGNGQEALDYLRDAEPPSVILLDLMMPVMDGWQFLSIRKQSRELASIPVVLVSAAGGLEQKAEGLSVSGHVSKPFEVKDLLGAVKKVRPS